MQCKTSAHTKSGKVLYILLGAIGTNISTVIYVLAVAQQHVSILIFLPLFNCHICYKGTHLLSIKKKANTVYLVDFRGSVYNLRTVQLDIQLLMVTRCSTALNCTYIHYTFTLIHQITYWSSGTSVFCRCIVILKIFFFPVAKSHIRHT